MSLITLVVVLIVVGVLLWLVMPTYPWTEDQVHPECRCRHCCRDWLLQVFGVLDRWTAYISALTDLKAGRRRGRGLAAARVSGCRLGIVELVLERFRTML